MKEQGDTDKSYLHAKDLSEPKDEFLIKKSEDERIKNLNDPKAFIEFLNTINDVYNNIDDHHPARKITVLIVFDGMIADIMIIKKFQAKIKEQFIRCGKLNI